MVICMYTDQLLPLGYITEQWWDKHTWDRGNLMDVDVPESILRVWYEQKLKRNYGNMEFEKWFHEESIADDMDGFFIETGWTPKLADIKYW